MSLTFRPARKADAASLAVLVDIAGEGMPAFMWSTLKTPGQSVLDVGRERARRDEGGFSYRNAIVAELDGEIAASLVSYRLDDPCDLGVLDDIPPIVHPLIRLESRAPGSWYVNVLATFPEFRHRGIGAKLLAIAEEQGREQGTLSLSVIVGSWNDGAARLYTRAGYSPSAREPAILPPDFPRQGDWVLMVRSLEASS